MSSASTRLSSSSWAQTAGQAIAEWLRVRTHVAHNEHLKQVLLVSSGDAHIDYVVISSLASSVERIVWLGPDALWDSSGPILQQTCSRTTPRSSSSSSSSSSVATSDVAIILLLDRQQQQQQQERYIDTILTEVALHQCRPGGIILVFQQSHRGVFALGSHLRRSTQQTQQRQHKYQDSSEDLSIGRGGASGGDEDCKKVSTLHYNQDDYDDEGEHLDFGPGTVSQGQLTDILRRACAYTSSSRSSSSSNKIDNDQIRMKTVSEMEVHHQLIDTAFDINSYLYETTSNFINGESGRGRKGSTSSTTTSFSTSSSSSSWTAALSRGLSGVFSSSTYSSTTSAATATATTTTITSSSSSPSYSSLFFPAYQQEQQHREYPDSLSALLGCDLVAVAKHAPGAFSDTIRKIRAMTLTGMGAAAVAASGIEDGHHPSSSTPPMNRQQMPIRRGDEYDDEGTESGIIVYAPVLVLEASIPLVVLVDGNVQTDVVNSREINVEKNDLATSTTTTTTTTALLPSGIAPRYVSSFVLRMPPLDLLQYPGPWLSHTPFGELRVEIPTLRRHARLSSSSSSSSSGAAVAVAAVTTTRREKCVSNNTLPEFSPIAISASSSSSGAAGAAGAVAVAAGAVAVAAVSTSSAHNQDGKENDSVVQFDPWFPGGRGRGGVFLNRGMMRWHEEREAWRRKPLGWARPKRRGFLVLSSQAESRRSASSSTSAEEETKSGSSSSNNHHLVMAREEQNLKQVIDMLMEQETKKYPPLPGGPYNLADVVELYVDLWDDSGSSSDEEW